MHTKGPWRVETEDGSIGTIAADDGTVVAQAQQVKPTRDDICQVERKANAHLIAAAPELLSMLEMCYITLDEGLESEGVTEAEHSRYARILLAECRAVIDKATAHLAR